MVIFKPLSKHDSTIERGSQSFLLPLSGVTADQGVCFRSSCDMMCIIVPLSCIVFQIQRDWREKRTGLRTEDINKSKSIMKSASWGS